MKHAAAGELHANDLEVLSYYAETENRELYWNYLAELPGNDGYGRLALGVVRNDNMPGATANAYAQTYAREHSGKVFTEREWDSFGVDLIKQDLAIRRKAFDRGDVTGALNLPGRMVQGAHDQAFSNLRVDPNAWTPRKLLETTRNHGADGAEKSEAIWKHMLDNDLAGARRGWSTLGDMAHAAGMSVAESASYGADMAAAWTSAIGDRSHLDPNVIGRNDHFYGRDRRGEWTEFTLAQPHVGLPVNEMTDVRDPGLLQELEDTHRLRMERQAARKDFHPDDPGRLVDSPHPLADAAPRTSFPQAGADPLYAAIRMQLPMDVSDDKAAQMALHARRYDIRNADDLRDVGIQGRHIVCAGRRPDAVASLDLASPAPPMEQSMAEGRQWDARMQQETIDTLSRQASRQPMAMHNEGPVLQR